MTHHRRILVFRSFPADSRVDLIGGLLCLLATLATFLRVFWG
jgi:hypothetical protein